MTPTETGTRPRVEGERELEILEATLEVLDEVGYDLLTMDAVATRAKASKATLYRRWKGKPELVVAAIMAHKGVPVVTIELPNAMRTPLDPEMRQMWIDLLRWMAGKLSVDAVGGR